MELDTGRRWVLMRDDEYFESEPVLGPDIWTTDRARACLYSTRRGAQHDFNVMAKRNPKNSLRIIEI